MSKLLFSAQLVINVLIFIIRVIINHSKQRIKVYHALGPTHFVPNKNKSLAICMPDQYELDQRIELINCLLILVVYIIFTMLS